MPAKTNAPAAANGTIRLTVIEAIKAFATVTPAAKVTTPNNGQTKK
jgi:hypothetical protein